MAEHFRMMAFLIDTERLSLRLRTKDDAECNLELLREHEGGTALSIGEVEQRMVEQNERAQVDGFGLLGIRRRYETSPIGYCGLVIGRGTFEEPEIAYEVLPGISRPRLRHGGRWSCDRSRSCDGQGALMGDSRQLEYTVVPSP